MAYFCYFSLGENLDFPDFLQISFITSTTSRWFKIIQSWRRRNWLPSSSASFWRFPSVSEYFWPSTSPPAAMMTTTTTTTTATTTTVATTRKSVFTSMPSAQRVKFRQFHWSDVVHFPRTFSRAANWHHRDRGIHIERAFSCACTCVY